MKNIKDVLREKEAALRQLEKEIEALRLAASLLNEEGSAVVAAFSAPLASPKSHAWVPLFEERSSDATAPGPTVSKATISGTTTLRQFP